MVGEKDGLWEDGWWEAGKRRSSAGGKIDRALE